MDWEGQTKTQQADHDEELLLCKHMPRINGNSTSLHEEKNTNKCGRHADDMRGRDDSILTRQVAKALKHLQQKDLVELEHGYCCSLKYTFLGKLARKKTQPSNTHPQSPPQKNSSALEKPGCQIDELPPPKTIRSPAAQAAKTALDQGEMGLRPKKVPLFLQGGSGD